MIEFANVFAYDPSAMVLAIGTAVLLTLAVLAAMRTNRVPSRVSAFDLAPAFGL